jgi:hypothetical protein
MLVIRRVYMCMCVCVCVCVYVCMYVCMCVCVCIYIYIYIYSRRSSRRWAGHSVGLLAEGYGPCGVARCFFFWAGGAAGQGLQLPMVLRLELASARPRSARVSSKMARAHKHSVCLTAGAQTELPEGQRWSTRTRPPSSPPARSGDGGAAGGPAGHFERWTVVVCVCVLQRWRQVRTSARLCSRCAAGARSQASAQEGPSLLAGPAERQAGGRGGGMGWPFTPWGGRPAFSRPAVGHLSPGAKLEPRLRYTPRAATRGPADACRRGKDTLYCEPRWSPMAWCQGRVAGHANPDVPVPSREAGCCQDATSMRVMYRSLLRSEDRAESWAFAPPPIRKSAARGAASSRPSLLHRLFPTRASSSTRTHIERTARSRLERSEPPWYRPWEAARPLPHRRQSRLPYRRRHRQRAATAPLSVWAYPALERGLRGGQTRPHTPSRAGYQPYAPVIGCG